VTREQRLAPFEVLDAGDTEGGDACKERVGEQTQGERACMPATGGQSAQEAAAAGLLVEVEGKGVELAGEALDVVGGHGDRAERKGLAEPQVLEVKPGGNCRIGHMLVLYVKQSGARTARGQGRAARALGASCCHAGSGREAANRPEPAGRE